MSRGCVCVNRESSSTFCVSMQDVCLRTCADLLLVFVYASVRRGWFDLVLECVKRFSIH